MSGAPEPRGSASAISVVEDDALLDIVAAGGLPSDGDAATELLSRWRSELDHTAQALPDLVMPHARPGHGRASRAAIGAVAAAALIATGGAAAAATGHPGPLATVARTLFGTHHDSADPTAARITSLLDSAEHRLDQARAAGVLTQRQHAMISAALHQAAALLRSDPAAPNTLGQRLRDLRRQLALLPTSNSAGTATPRPVTSTAPASTPAPRTHAEPSPAAPASVEPNPAPTHDQQHGTAPGDDSTPTTANEPTGGDDRSTGDDDGNQSTNPTDDAGDDNGDQNGDGSGSGDHSGDGDSSGNDDGGQGRAGSSGDSG